MLKFYTFWVDNNKCMIYRYNTFEYSEQKRNLIMNLRCVDIAVDAIVVLCDKNAITVLSTQKEEIRYKTTGLFDNKLWTVIHTPRNGNCRIVTMRRAHKNEEMNYYEN